MACTIVVCGCVRDAFYAPVKVALMQRSASSQMVTMRLDFRVQVIVFEESEASFYEPRYQKGKRRVEKLGRMGHRSSIER
jgi:hypothetical protein